ncbi:hypothetical protein DPX16_1416 [Anabarilius grahami]|uniref:Uncharacterized protein n=1 Tax=Anabarilius grahami TaxID=495550 RepID=A0A3N0YKU1_ANAGA|nr:hypothetical protein DPX16_1416 [Anabarilius grahami]
MKMTAPRRIEKGGLLNFGRALYDDIRDDILQRIAQELQLSDADAAAAGDAALATPAEEVPGCSRHIINTRRPIGRWTVRQRRRHVVRGNVPITLITGITEKCLLRVLLGAVQIAAQLKTSLGELPFTDADAAAAGDAALAKAAEEVPGRWRCRRKCRYEMPMPHFAPALSPKQWVSFHISRLKTAGLRRSQVQ